MITSIRMTIESYCMKKKQVAVKPTRPITFMVEIVNYICPYAIAGLETLLLLENENADVVEHKMMN